MNLHTINQRELYRKWKSNLNAFEPFLRSSPFVSLQTYRDINIDDSEVDFSSSKLFLEESIIPHLNDSKFLIIDLPFEEILSLSVLLNNLYSIKPILNLNFLFHPYGLIGDDSQVQHLIKCTSLLEDISPKGFVMVLDYNRFGDFTEDQHSLRLNNQYELSSYDLPYGQTLLTLGYDEILYICETQEKIDIKECLNYLNETIPVKIIKAGKNNE